MAVSREEVQRIAALSRLSLTADEVAKFSTELTAILDAMREMQAIPTDDIAPYDLPPVVTSDLRPDEPMDRHEASAILDQAPDRVGTHIRLGGGTFSS